MTGFSLLIMFCNLSQTMSIEKNIYYHLKEYSNTSKFCFNDLKFQFILYNIYLRVIF